MERKLIALVSIALLAGLGGGYGLGYVIYQPQVQNLQTDLRDLDDRFDTLNSTLRDAKTSVTSLQNGLSSTNSKITLLNSSVEEIEGRAWYEASSLEGSSSAIGANFQMKGEVMRIRWIMEGVDSTAWIQIFVNFSNATMFAERGSSGTYGSHSSDIAETNLAGQYYIQVVTYNVNYYLVVVWDYY